MRYCGSIRFRRDSSRVSAIVPGFNGSSSESFLSLRMRCRTRTWARMFDPAAASSGHWGPGDGRSIRLQRGEESAFQGGRASGRRSGRLRSRSSAKLLRTGRRRRELYSPLCRKMLRTLPGPPGPTKSTARVIIRAKDLVRHNHAGRSYSFQSHSPTMFPLARPRENWEWSRFRRYSSKGYSVQKFHAELEIAGNRATRYRHKGGVTRHRNWG